VIVLASGSASRAAVLSAAGLAVTVDPADIDESAVKAAHRGESAAALARRLAQAKAMAVAARHPGTWVIGADQILECEDGQRFDKPADRAAAAAQLRTLSGRMHRLLSAVSLVRDGAERWATVEEARLWVRPLSHAFVDSYLDRAGAAVLSSVGAYQLEGLGVHLFERIEGDHFTILGLPLLSLLAALRARGEIEG